MVIERVIYCALSTLALFSPGSYELLSRRSDGAVIAVADPRSGDWLIRDPALSLLYFSRSAYEDAVRGLPDSEIDPVVGIRRQQLASNVAGQGLAWLDTEARRALALTAVAAAASPATATRLNQHFEELLHLLVVISGEHRYQALPFPSLLVLVIESEAQFHGELLQARDAARLAGDRAADQEFDTALQRSEKQSREIGALLKGLGRPEYGQAMPFAGSSRGVFVSPRDPALLELVRGQREAHRVWKDGLVAEWATSDIPRLEASGKAVRILYFDSREMRLDLQRLTAAQLEREFGERLAGGNGASMLRRREHLNSLWLELHLARRKALAATRDAATVGLLSQQVEQEALALRASLAGHPAWLANAVPPAAAPDALQQSEKALLQDAGFLAALAAQSGDTVAEKLFARIAGLQPAGR